MSYVFSPYLLVSRWAYNREICVVSFCNSRNLRHYESEPARLLAFSCVCITYILAHDALIETHVMRALRRRHLISQHPDVCTQFTLHCRVPRQLCQSSRYNSDLIHGSRLYSLISVNLFTRLTINT